MNEQLFPSKVKCKFTQHMPNKTDKFVIKFWILIDVVSKFLYKVFQYLGKSKSRSDTETVFETIVMSLLIPYLNTGRNVTTNHYKGCKIEKWIFDVETLPKLSN